MAPLVAAVELIAATPVELLEVADTPVLLLNTTISTQDSYV